MTRAVDDRTTDEWLPTNGSLSLTCAILRRVGPVADYTGQNAGENAPTPRNSFKHFSRLTVGPPLRAPSLSYANGS